MNVTVQQLEAALTQELGKGELTPEQAEADIEPFRQLAKQNKRFRNSIELLAMLGDAFGPRAALLTAVVVGVQLGLAIAQQPSVPVAKGNIPAAA